MAEGGLYGIGSNQSAGSAVGANPSIATIGNSAPLYATQVSGVDGGGIARILSTDASGVLNVNAAFPSSLDTNLIKVGGTAFALGQQLAAASIPVVLTAAQITSLTPPTTVTVIQPTGANLNAVVSGTVTANQGTANATPWNANIAQIGGASFALGQQLAASSLPVVLTAAQIATLTPLSSVTVTQATGTNLHTVVDSSAIPNGASTSALQTTGNTSLASIDTKTPALGQALAAASVPVVLTAAQITTLTPPATVTVIQPTGANLNAVVSGTVTANQGTANGTPWNENIAQFGGTSVTLGSKVSASSMPVVIASDQVAFAVKMQDGSANALTSANVGTGTYRAIDVRTVGRNANAHLRNDYTATNVTTSAYVQLTAATSANVMAISIFDSSGQTLVLAFGAAASEIDQIYIFPGGNGPEPLYVPGGTRLSIKAVSATANAGEIDIILYAA